VLGPVWVWIVVSQRPSTTTVIGGLIVLGAVVFDSTLAPEPAPAPI
jgi:hypothetical protein